MYSCDRMPFLDRRDRTSNPGGLGGVTYPRSSVPITQLSVPVLGGPRVWLPPVHLEYTAVSAYEREHVPDAR
jgi:hypothetical protein